MGNLFGKTTTDAGPLDNQINCDSRSPSPVYNGAQPSGMESAQTDKTEPMMRNSDFVETNDSIYAECADYPDERVVSNTGCRTVGTVSTVGPKMCTT